MDDMDIHNRRKLYKESHVLQRQVLALLYRCTGCFALICIQTDNRGDENGKLAREWILRLTASAMQIAYAFRLARLRDTRPWGLGLVQPARAAALVETAIGESPFGVSLCVSLRQGDCVVHSKGG